MITAIPISAAGLALGAAMVFFVAGIGTCITALKIFTTQRHIDKEINNDSSEYRKNVLQIRVEERYDI